MALRASIPMYQKRGNRIVTTPATEPVTAAELRTYLSETATQLPDADADAYIAVARQFIEDQTGLALITQTWLVALDRWPSGREPWWDGVRQGAISELTGVRREYDLPRYPLISIGGVNVYDESGSATAVNVANTFDVDTYRMPGRLALKNGAAWPVALRNTNAIEITYSAGYGAASDVPAPLVQAVKQFAGHLYEKRGECDLSDAYSTSGAQGMAGMYQVARL